MADGTLEILAKQKLRAKRAGTKSIFSFSFENNTSIKRTAELFSNKTGFSQRSIISSFSDTEVFGWKDDWVNDGDLAGRLAGIVYNDNSNKTIVFHLNNASTKVKIYEVNNDFSYTLKATLTFTGALTGAKQVLYCKTTGNYYVVGKGASSRISAQTILANFTLGVYSNWTSGTSYIGQLGVKENANVGSQSQGIRIFFTYRLFGNVLGKFKILDPTNAIIQSSQELTLSSADTNHRFGCVYDEISNKYFILQKNGNNTEINAVGYSNTGSLIAQVNFKTYNFPINGTISIVDNKLFVTGIDENGNGFLDKFNMATNQLISSSSIESTFTTTKPFVFTDNKNNFYLTNNSILTGYDVDGKIILRQLAGSRSNPISNSSGGYNIGGNEMNVESGQFYNTSNDTFSFNATTSQGSISVFNPTFTGGLNGFDLPTSAGDYNMALIEFNTQPIKISGMLIYYKNGGNSQNNIIKYLEETSTGKAKSKLIQPRNYITADSSDDKSIEIEFDTPIILDTSHFFKMDVEANESITMVLFYNQAEAKDILANKVLG